MFIREFDVADFDDDYFWVMFAIANYNFPICLIGA